MNHQANPRFIQDIWSRLLQQAIPHKSLKSLFIQGIKHGNLNPDCYITFGVQDSYYLFVNCQLWLNTQQRCRVLGQADLQQICHRQYVDYDKFVRDFTSKFGILRQGIVPNAAVEIYVQSEDAYVNNNIYNILLTNYACYKLWPWIVSQIKDESPKDNVYQGWIDANGYDQPALDLQETINRFQDKFDQNEAYELIKKMLLHEAELFDSFCQ